MGREVQSYGWGVGRYVFLEFFFEGREERRTEGREEESRRELTFFSFSRFETYDIFARNHPLPPRPLRLHPLRPPSTLFFPHHPTIPRLPRRSHLLLPLLFQPFLPQHHCRCCRSTLHPPSGSVPSFGSDAVEDRIASEGGGKRRSRRKEKGGRFGARAGGRRNDEEERS